MHTNSFDSLGEVLPECVQFASDMERISSVVVGEEPADADAALDKHRRDAPAPADMASNRREIEGGVVHPLQADAARRKRAEMHQGGGRELLQYPPLAIHAALKRITGPTKQWQAGGELFPIIRTLLCLTAYESDPAAFTREHPNMHVHFSPHLEPQAPPSDRPLEFAPPSLQTMFAFCAGIRAQMAETARRPLMIAVDIFDGKSVANAAFLLSAFLMLECGYTAEEAVLPFEQVVPMPYVDYSLGITVFDVVRGLGKAIAKGWVTRAAPVQSAAVCRPCPEFAFVGSRKPKLAELRAAGITALALTGRGAAPSGFDEASVSEVGMKLHQMLPLETADDTILDGIVDPDGVVGLVGYQGPAFACLHMMQAHGFLSDEAAGYAWVHFRGREKPGNLFMTEEQLAALEGRDPPEVQQARVDQRALKQQGLSSPKLKHLRRGGGGSTSPTGGGGATSPTGSARGVMSPLRGGGGTSPIQGSKGRTSPSGKGTPLSGSGSSRRRSSPMRSSPMDAVAALPQSSIEEPMDGDVGTVRAVAGRNFDMGPVLTRSSSPPGERGGGEGQRYSGRTGAKLFLLSGRGSAKNFYSEAELRE